MKKNILLGVFLASTVLLGGCAMTKDNINLNYQLGKSDGKILSAKNNARVSVSVRDKRDVSNPNIIMHKENVYHDVTSGEYLAEKPIAAIIQNAFSSGLTQMGYGLGNNSGYSFVCDVLEIKPTYVMGVFKGTIRMKIQLNVRVYNKSHSALVWENMIVGHGSVDTAWGGDDSIKIAFNNAVTDAVRQLQKSKSFVASLNK